LKFLIVALGNIGVEYTYTRHNIGFLIADRMASKHSFEFKSDRLADVAEFRLKNKMVTIIKPTTYMNLSGKAYKYWMNKLDIPASQVIVVVDDLALPFGALRIKLNGSAGGHNGLSNIEQELNSGQYPRLRFGIGNEFSKGGQVDFVLGKWDENEVKLLPEYMDNSIAAIEECILAGFNNGMNKFNTKKAKDE
jgi:peptidyl-tRNA hydrolase, PTH1 family